LQNKFKDRGFRVVAVNVDDQEGTKARTIQQQFGINYTFLSGTNEVSEDFGGVYALPTSFLIGRDGMVKEKLVGLHSLEEVQAKVEAEL